MTNKSNIATALYIVSIIRSSVGYVVFSLPYLCLFSMQSQIHSVWLTSRKTTPVWNMQKQRVRKISLAMQLVLASRAYLLVIISKLKFPVIISFALFLISVWRNLNFQRSYMCHAIKKTYNFFFPQCTDHGIWTRAGYTYHSIEYKTNKWWHTRRHLTY